ncbi:MAG: response regulator [Bacteroidales bacterium]|jgi:two-component system alkaline phosphatase synthesis response regulator PhoP|nr:response regulator [Bacteroidales bacterium]MDD3736870.1 response regulator [Bacteroidales bacterium]HNT92476.1 response regulator [Bacteroidales bacterium]HOO65319.1 response regulator [Bacteroidales bacterium]HPE21451.1 response regulator [Bacteroidales bacterium]
MNKVYTVLLVDDDPDYLFQVAFYLRKEGFEVIAVESQAEAEQVIAKMKPDIAVFDLMMESDDSGFILCYKLKRRYPEVPVILATAVSRETGITFGLSGEQDRDWIRADLYLEKGVRPEQLEQELRKLLKI